MADLTPEDRGRSPGQLARELGVGEQTVRNWIMIGVHQEGNRAIRHKLAAVRLGGRWRVTQQALEVFLQALHPSPPAPRPTVSEATKRARRAAAVAGLRRHGIHLKP